jgi:hypothetical protein
MKRITEKINKYNHGAKTCCHTWRGGEEQINRITVARKKEKEKT